MRGDLEAAMAAAADLHARGCSATEISARLGMPLSVVRALIVMERDRRIGPPAPVLFLTPGRRPQAPPTMRRGRS